MKSGNSYFLYELKKDAVKRLSELLTSPGKPADKPVSEREIQALAYNWLQEADQKIIKNWESAKITEHKFTTNVMIGSKKGRFDIKGKDTYMVLFDTSNDLLGIYIDKESNCVLGMVFEDKDLV